MAVETSEVCRLGNDDDSSSETGCLVAIEDSDCRLATRRAIGSHGSERLDEDEWSFRSRNARDYRLGFD